jgi:group I intron endonuclease
MIGIYGIHCKSNDKWYIGESININQRMMQHKANLRSNYHDNNYLQSAWNKYGEEEFEFIILEAHDIADKTYLFERESYWMGRCGYPSPNSCFNLKEAGIYSPYPIKLKQKISESLKGKKSNTLGKKHSEESKRKMSEAKKGTKLSDETKHKISNIKRGQPVSPECREKISNTLKGHSVCNETRQKLSKSHKGKKHTEETKLKMSNAQKIYWANNDDARKKSQKIKAQMETLS